MPYTKTSWVSGSTPVSAPNMNNIETAYDEASQSFEQDLFTAFVFSGLVASKDSVTATTLNLTAGVAFVKQTDNTLRRRAITGQSFTTVTISTTYYLDLNPDGTLSWATAHSGVANYLPICQVTTDSSGNILTVSDKRVLTTGILGSGVLAPSVASQSSVTPQTPNLAAAINGTLTFGAAGVLSGDPDTAATFSGTQVVLVPTQGLSSGNAAWTIEAWVKISANPAAATYYHVAFMGTMTVKNLVQMRINSSGNVELDLYGAATLTSAAPISLGAVHHLVGTYDGTNLKLTVDNGTPVSTNPSGMTIIFGNMVLGGQSGGVGPSLVGTLDEVAIYSTALSVARIAAHYAAATTGGYSAAVLADSPLRYYRLGEAVGATYAGCTLASASTLATLGTDGSSALGRLASVGGQATVGTLGAPAIVAQVLAKYITATTLTTILNYTPTRTGLYRVSVYVALLNSVSGKTINVNVGWNDGTTGSSAPASNVFLGYNGTMQQANGVNSFPNGYYAGMPLTIYAQGGQPIVVVYQDPANVPADYVTVLVERIA